MICLTKKSLIISVSLRMIFISIKNIFKNILTKYFNFADKFLKNLAIKLLKYLNITKYIINLEFDKETFYKLI